MATANFISEEWEIIPNFPNYAVSSFGRVKRVVTNKYHPHQRILTNCLDKDGYHIVTLWNVKAKTAKVHQLVATAFIGPRPDGLDVNHKNGIKTDNVPDNLEYLTPAENQKHAALNGLKASGDRNAMRKHPERSHFSTHSTAPGRGSANPNAKIDENAVRIIRQRLASGEKLAHVARDYQMNPVSVAAIRDRKTWSHI